MSEMYRNGMDGLNRHWGAVQEGMFDMVNPQPYDSWQ